MKHFSRNLSAPSGLVLLMRRDFFQTLVGNILYAVAQWGILVVLAKLGSVEMVGQFALGAAIGLPILLATNLYLRALVATDQRGDYVFGDYFGLRILTTLLAGAVILLVVWLGAFPMTTAWVILILGVGRMCDALADVCLGLFQQRGQLNYFAATIIVNGLVSLAALGLAMWLTRDIVWAALGSTLGSAIALVGVALPGAIRILQPTLASGANAFAALRPRWNGPTLRTLAWRAAPLGFASLRAVLGLNLPRYFIAYDQGEHALGIFAALVSLVLAGLIVTSSLTVSLTARLASYHAARNAAAFRRLMVQLVEIGLMQGAVAVAVALTAGSLVLTLVFGSEYAAYQNLLVWLALVGGFYAILGFLETGLTALQQYTIQMQVQLLALALLGALCAWLVPPYGVYGAAFAMLASALFAAATYAAALRHYFNQAFC